MKSFNSIVYTEIRESMRTKWFFLYSLIFGGAVITLYSLGITESQVLGFVGISRVLIIFIQLCLAILPIFILISTVRAVVGDRETHVLEYFLSMPISLRAYFWGKFLGKLLVVFIPTALALIGATLWGFIKGLEVALPSVFLYIVLLFSLIICFLGLGMFISSIVKKVEWALGLSFLIWLTQLLFIDVLLIGIMLKYQIKETLIVAVTLLNPLQVFRVASILVFDPEGSILGPSSYVILDSIGRTGFLVFSTIYPISIGFLLAILGYSIFRKGDLV